MNKDFRLKVKSLDEDGTFEGYAAVFGNVDLDGDRIEPTAFNRTLKNFRGEVPILWDHDTGKLAGVSTELLPDGHGLLLKGKLVLGTTVGREAYEYLKARAVKGLSIGVQVIDAGWDGSVRVLKELRLHEISLVAIPANPLAEVVAVKRCVSCDVQDEAETPGEAPDCSQSIAEKALPLDASAASDSGPGDAHSLSAADMDVLKSLVRDECIRQSIARKEVAKWASSTT